MKPEIITCAKCGKMTGNYVMGYESDDAFCEDCAGALEAQWESQMEDEAWRLVQHND